jgi:electron transport complex protein RnfA
MADQNLFMIFLSAILINNVIFSRFLGICPYLGVSKKTSTAFGMGAAVIFVMALSTALTWPLQKLLLDPLGLGYLQTISFILVIAALVQLVEFVLKKSVPGLYQALGIYLPLITTNCAVLGIAILNINENLDFIQSLVFTIASAVGFTLALLIFAGIRERLALRNIPAAFQGVPIGLVVAGLLAMAFMGFAGLGAR